MTSCGSLSLKLLGPSWDNERDPVFTGAAGDRICHQKA
jgi:hypothetical protein